jgi:hypothetical protein
MRTIALAVLPILVLAVWPAAAQQAGGGAGSGINVDRSSIGGTVVSDCVT